MERNWELFDLLLERIGGDELSLAICKALTMDDMNEILDYIANCMDIETGEEED